MAMKSKRETPLIEALLAKYRSDAQGFRDYLPKVAQQLDHMFPGPRHLKSPFGLTDNERSHRLTMLKALLAELEEDALNSPRAAQALEHCAVLIEDDSLPEDIDADKLSRLLRVVLGRSPGSFKKTECIPVQDIKEDGRTLHKQVSLLLGVTLALTRDMRLISIMVSPSRIRERRKAFHFVGIAQDPQHDASRLHNHYLANTDSHATS